MGIRSLLRNAFGRSRTGRNEPTVPEAREPEAEPTGTTSSSPTAAVPGPSPSDDEPAVKEKEESGKASASVSPENADLLAAFDSPSVKRSEPRREPEPEEGAAPAGTSGAVPAQAGPETAAEAASDPAEDAHAAADAAKAEAASLPAQSSPLADRDIVASAEAQADEPDFPPHTGLAAEGAAEANAALEEAKAQAADLSANNSPKTDTEATEDEGEVPGEGSSDEPGSGQSKITADATAEARDAVEEAKAQAEDLSTGDSAEAGGWIPPKTIETGEADRSRTGNEAAVEAEPDPAAKTDAPVAEVPDGTPKKEASAGDATAAPLAKVETVAPALVDLCKTAAAGLERQGLAGQRAAVYLVLDRSGSMRRYYKDGTVQHLAEQALGLSVNLDDDGTVPVVFFSTDIDGTADLSLEDYAGRIETLHSGLGHMGRTNYHRAIEEVVEHYKKSGSTGPAFVIFQTDGAPTGKVAAEKALCEAAELPIFWQFIGFGEPEAKGFDFLRKLDVLSVPEKRKVDNAGFFHAGLEPKDLSDAELYEQLLVEFPEWLAEARRAKILD